MPKPTTATIDPNDFSTEINNLNFPLKPGTTYIYQSPDGSEIVEFEVTRDTIDIEVAPGVFVECVVVKDTVTVNGELVNGEVIGGVVLERTEDYFAQNVVDGSVWYFGEDVTNFIYKKGVLIGTNEDGEWLAGVDGAQPGRIMLGDPQPGDEYFQENAPGVAQDHAKVISVNANVDGGVPYLEGSPDGLLQIEETTPLDKQALEWKFYASGIGQLAVVNPHGEKLLEQLVTIRFDGTDQADVLVGNVGNDTLNGGLGKDTMNGGLGNDTLNGGPGKDTMNGGLGFDTFVFAAAGFGDDTIQGFDADPAGGGQDLLDVRSLGITFSDVTISPGGGGGTEIGIGGDSITLLDVTTASISQTDFLFV